MNRKRFHLGSMAVLFTVVIVCVSVFGALTVMTAAQDLRMSRQYAAKVQQLYDCEALGQQWLGQVEDALRGGDPLPPGTWQEGEELGVTLETDTMSLDIGLGLTAHGYEIRRWSCEAKWQPQTEYNFWQ